MSEGFVGGWKSEITNRYVVRNLLVFVNILEVSNIVVYVLYC